MSFRIVRADTAAQREKLFRARHDAYVRQNGWEPSPDGMFVDAYDAWPASDCANFMAINEEGTCIGGIRMLRRREPELTSTDQLFDYRPHLDPNRSACSASWLWSRADRGQARLTSALLGTVYLYAALEGYEQVYAALIDKLWPMSRHIGGRPLADDYQEYRGHRFMPCAIDTRDLYKFDAVAALLRSHDLHGFLGVWTRAYYDAGETVLRRGDPVEECYVVIRGSAAVRDAEGRVTRLDRPTLFGDLEMMLGLNAGADVVAETPLDLLVLDRDTYLDRVRNHPTEAVSLGRLLHEAGDVVELRASAPDPVVEIELGAQADANRDVRPAALGRQRVGLDEAS